MKIEDLKNSIENKIELNNLLIFNCKAAGADFIFHQYINKFADGNNYEIKHLDFLSDIYASFLFDTDESSSIIYIYEADKLEEVPNTNQKVWLKCKSISKKLYEEHDEIIVDIPKLEDWHIEDYIQYNLPTLLETDRKKLFSHYKSNMFRLELEIEKIKLFEDNLPTKYYQIENQLFTDLTEYNIFNITNCTLKRDIEALNRIKYSIQDIDVDPFGLLTVLIKNFRHVIDIQLAKNSTPEYVGVSSKQFWAISNYSCGFYSKDELVYIYKLLLSLDRKMKSGEIPLDMVIDYIICKILLI
jgi:hypothetical protein